MKNLFDGALANQIKLRIDQLRPDSQRQWGYRSPAKVLAHCALGLEMALGDIKPHPMFVGRLMGFLIKPMVFGNDEPFRRNSPTLDELVVHGEPELDEARRRLCSLIDRFTSSGISACSPHPHPYFGRLTPIEWAILNYKHLDHHLRQFNV